MAYPVLSLINSRSLRDHSMPVSIYQKINTSGPLKPMFIYKMILAEHFYKFDQPLQGGMVALPQNQTQFSRMRRMLLYKMLSLLVFDVV